MNTLTRKSRNSHATTSHGKPARAKPVVGSAPTQQEVKVMVAASEKMADKVKNQGYMPDFV